MTAIARRYWPLIALLASKAHERRLTPMQLQKALFLVAMNVGDAVGNDNYRFVPYLYGPFSKSISRDVEDLVEEGLVTAVPSPDKSWSAFELNPAGAEVASALAANLAPQAREYVEAVVRWVCSTPTSAMLRAIYEHYPEYATNSVACIER